MTDKCFMDCFEHSFVGPSAKVGKNTQVGVCTIIEDGAEIGDNCFIGNFCHIRPGVRILSGSEIRDYCYIAQNAVIGERVKIFQYTNVGMGTLIQKDVYIGAKVMITNTNRISHGRSYQPEVTPCMIMRGARIASGAKLKPGVVIGGNSLVGMGAVVTKDVPACTIVMGVPAKVVGTVPEEERI